MKDKEEKSNKKNKANPELEKLKNELEVLNDKNLRLAAEMQNMMRRNEENIRALRKFEGEELIKSILPIVDNFERAISMDDDNLQDDVSKFLEGFKLIYVNLINVLKSSGVMEIDCLGQQFDPLMMEAVMTEHNPEEESNVVIDVMQKGYTYNDRVIRVAMVKVNE